jgi:HK97 family phage major capsid protein
MSTRIQFIAAVPDHKVGDIFNCEDDNVAMQYVNLKLAKQLGEAPDPFNDLMEKFSTAAQKGFEAGMTLAKSSHKVGGSGPDIEVTKDESDQVPKTFGDWLQNVGFLEHPETSYQTKTLADKRLKEVYKTKSVGADGFKGNFVGIGVGKATGTMMESSGPTGGYAVPPEYVTDIWKIAVEDTILASRARKRAMASNELKYPKLDQTGTNIAGVATGYLGGVVAGWSAETYTGNQTRASLKQGVLKAGELKGYTIVTNELLQDNKGGLEALIRELFAEAISYYTDLATLVGDGVDKPYGVVNHASTLTVNRSGGANTFVYADAVSMKSKLLAKSMQTAFWVMNQTVMPQLMSMTDGAGRNIWLPNVPGGVDGPVTYGTNSRFLELPYFWTEKLPALGTKGDVTLVDPLGYMIGDRMALEIAASPHAFFLNNEMAYRFIARIAGQPMLDLPFTMLDGAHQLSTAVVLV